MADYKKFVPVLKKHEGGWSDDQSDPGGATMCGVTLATFREFYGDERTKEDLRNITNGQWSKIMKTYWDRCQGDKIENQSIAEILVDWCVNSGTTAIRKMQFRLGLKADGIVGPKTLAALNTEDARYVFDTIKSARVDYYNDLGKRMPKFLKGWLNRTNSFKFEG